MFATDCPFGQFFDREGRPLSAGFLYYGQPSMNPETSPISVYWDAAGTLPAGQPISTLNGYPVRSGTPAIVYAEGAYSLLIKNKRGETVYYLADSTDLPSALPVALASKTSATKGSAMLGHNQVLTYPGGSVGDLLNDQMVDVQGHPFNAVADGVTDARQAVIDGLAHCHSTGKTLYFPPGTYYFSDSIKPTAGSKLLLRGAHRDLVTITCAANKIPFYCDQAIGVNNRVAGVDIEGITFDGGHTRDPAFYPYNADPGASIIQALNMRGEKGGGDTCDARISRCRFKDINGLPIWVADFDGSVEISFNEFIRTKDPGILYNNNVTIVGNVCRFSADNGLSISRSNQNIYIAYNHIVDCASAGIFVGGINSTGSGASLTATGASYAVGATLTLVASASKFGTEDQGINFTLRSGTDRAIVRVVSVESGTSCTVVALRAVPASLQATSTADWARGPISGAQAGSIVNNIIEGASGYGIHLSAGCKDLTVSGNTIRRTGITADSEVFTTGTMLASSATLTLADGSDFATNDWVVVLPDYTSEDYFIAQATLVAGNVITASAAPTQTLVNERVHRAYRRTAAFGILALGAYESATILEFAENIEIVNNVIVDSVTGGIRAGSSGGAIRKSSIFKNRIALRQNAHVEPAVYGVLASDVGNTDMRTVLLSIKGNDIRMNSASGSRGISYKPIDSNVASYIEIGPNSIQECVTEVEVIEQTGSTDITRTYKPIVQSSPLPILSLQSIKNLGAEAGAATFNAGVLTLTQIVSAITPSASIVVTDLALDASVLHDTPIICIRNAHATRTITLTYDAAKIRVDGAVDYVINGYGMVLVFQISAGLWQVLGKP